MKVTALLPLVAITTAFVIPDEAMANQIALENTQDSIFDSLPSKDSIFDSVRNVFNDAVAAGENAFDSAISKAEEAKDMFVCHHSMTAFDTQGWLDSATPTIDDMDFDILSMDHPHHDPHKRPHKKHPHHHKPNLTVYELIAKSKYTTKLAGLINKFPNLVVALNGTTANYTVFAPTDKAFEKIPKHHKEISDEFIYQVLAYHVADQFYPAGRLLASHTIPTLKEEASLGGEKQRLRVGLGLKGLSVNFYSHVVAANIFGTNGVIHGVDSLLFPPSPSTKIIELLPGEFSTFELALAKTGLGTIIKETPHLGGTLFAPNNWAFKKLGPRINAFLFSPHGVKYLGALLKYHVVANQTLYSDAFYNHAGGADVEVGVDADVAANDVPKGRFHVDLPTALDGKSLSIDIVRFGGFISIRINGYNSVAVQDGIAKDGVIHVVSSVLIPPKTPGGASEEVEDDSISVKELMERLGGYVEEL